MVDRDGFTPHETRLTHASFAAARNLVFTSVTDAEPHYPLPEEIRVAYARLDDPDLTLDTFTQTVDGLTFYAFETRIERDGYSLADLIMVPTADLADQRAGRSRLTAIQMRIIHLAFWLLDVDESLPHGTCLITDQREEQPRPLSCGHRIRRDLLAMSTHHPRGLIAKLRRLFRT